MIFLIIGILSNFLYYHIGSGSKNGSNRVGLASKRVQIRVQPYNVLNKPEWTRFEPDFGSGWAPRVQIQVESGPVGPPGSKFGLNRVRLVGFIWQHYLGVNHPDLKLKSKCRHGGVGFQKIRNHCDVLIEQVVCHIIFFGIDYSNAAWHLPDELIQTS